MLLLGYANALAYPDFRVYECLNVVLIAAPIYYAGYLLKDISLAGKNLVIVLLGALVSLLVVVLNHLQNWRLVLSFDMRIAVYGIPIFSLAGAICCCLALIPVCNGLAKIKPASVLFSELGRASLIIMFVHFWVIFVFPFAGSEYNVAKVLCTLLVSYLAYRLCLKYAFTRKYLMGLV